MSTNTNVAIGFKNTGQGQAHVSFLGPDGFDQEFDIPGDFNHDFDLQDGNYQITVTGTSGSTATLDVTAGGVKLVSDSCPPVEIEMDDAFELPPVAPGVDEEA